MELAEHKYVNIKGVNVHYIEGGKGPAVLLVHGLGTSLITWHQNFDSLVGAGYRVLALDLPGHKSTPRESRGQQLRMIWVFWSLLGLIIGEC
jgi:pimeloyl-ACP methyl ester carboxylesterase